MTTKDYALNDFDALTRDLLGAAHGKKHDPIGDTLRKAFRDHGETVLTDPATPNSETHEDRNQA